MPCLKSVASETASTSIHLEVPRCVHVHSYYTVCTYVIVIYPVHEQYRVKQAISQSISFTGGQLAAYQCMPVLFNVTKSIVRRDSEGACRV